MEHHITSLLELAQDQLDLLDLLELEFNSFERNFQYDCNAYKGCNDQCNHSHQLGSLYSEVVSVNEAHHIDSQEVVVQVQLDELD